MIMRRPLLGFFPYGSAYDKRTNHFVDRVEESRLAKAFEVIKRKLTGDNRIQSSGIQHISLFIFFI